MIYLFYDITLALYFSCVRVNKNLYLLLYVCMYLLALVSVTESSSIYWELHPQKVCLGMEHLVDELARIEAVGGEGLMLRDVSAPHR